VKHELFDRFGIDHTTIQIESETYAHLGEVH
jgi:cobalt-zinc-cadmium efflux system protein